MHSSGCRSVLTPSRILAGFRCVTLCHALRCFDNVHTGTLWEWYQNKIRTKYADAVIAALQLYSDKTLLNFKGEQWGVFGVSGVPPPCKISVGLQHSAPLLSLNFTLSLIRC